MCPGGVPPAVSFGAALVPGSATTAGVPTAASSTATSTPSPSTAEGVLTSVSTSARDLSIAARVLTVVSSSTEVVGFLDDFRFLLQGLARPCRLSNFLFRAEDLMRLDLRTRTNTKSSDSKSPFIPASSRILLTVIELAKEVKQSFVDYLPVLEMLAISSLSWSSLPSLPPQSARTAWRSRF
ncbi:hypothetical protein DL98DRAFT_218122 [Cadophora sp. DSE1049]|nr:hypothetical protein DL98DRAFT_218122 [Cadophora sp. DSE1049]